MDRFARLNNLLEHFTKTTVPGCTCTIAQNGEILYEGAFGYADIEEKKPVTKESIFRQASTTKLFTYAISMMLYEQGKFLLNEPIYEYLPEWRNTTKFVTLPNGELAIEPVANPITIRDALTMSCGLPYCMQPDLQSTQPTQRAMSQAIAPLLQKGIPTLREEVRAMAAVPIMFEPGTHWQYGFGSEIIGALLEEITGKTVRQLFRDYIIGPLGLKNTETLLTGNKRDRLVVNYHCTPEGKFEKAPSSADDILFPGNAPEGSRAHLLASATDFAIFMQMLASGGVHKGERMLSKGTIKMMAANYLNDDQLIDFTNSYNAGYGYGLGVRVLIDKAAGQHNGPLGAFGWTGGFGTWAESDVASGASIVYMHNMMPNKEEHHHLRMRAVAYGCL